jgi:hypothetical protein
MEDDVKSGLLVVFAIIVIALIGYNIYTGATIKELGIPGIFTISFNQKPEQSGDSTTSSQGGSNSNPSTQTGTNYSANNTQLSSLTGNWTGTVGDLTVTVTKVELLGLIGEKSACAFICL